MLIRDFPFTGIGIGTFSQIADNFYPFFLSEPGSIHHTHNVFLQIAVDLGVPGFILWSMIFLLVIRDAWDITNQRKCITNETLYSFGIGLLGSYLAFAIHGMLDMTVWGMMRLPPLTWGLWGLAVAAHLVLRKQFK
jgi:putative inorganic carbon (HCO3(-)) transporter